MFASRKAPLSTILHGIAMRLHEPKNILQTSREIGVTYKTAYSWAKSFRLLLGDANNGRVQDAQWPFIRSARREPPAIVSIVNRAISHRLPEQVRADVAQDMILGVLSGELTEDDLRAHVARYISKHYRTVETPYLAVSLNQPVPGTNGMNWNDILADDVERA